MFFECKICYSANMQPICFDIYNTKLNYVQKDLKTYNLLMSLMFFNVSKAAFVCKNFFILLQLKMFSILIYFKRLFIPVMAKLNFCVFSVIC